LPSLLRRATAITIIYHAVKGREVSRIHRFPCINASEHIEGIVSGSLMGRIFRQRS
jgi:hypothetical protein